MPRLPDPYQKARPAPGYGRPLKVSPLVEEDKGAGLSALGKQVSGLADVLLKVQARDDKFAAISAQTQLDAWAIDDRLNGWALLKAENVTDSLIPDADNRFSTKRDELSAGLSNDNQREEFGRRAALINNRIKSNLFTHVAAQKKVAHDNTFNASIKLSVETVAASWDNLNEVLIALNSVKDSTALWAEENGIKGDTLEMLQKENASALHITVIGEAVDANDFRYAQGWLDINRKSMTDADIDKAESIIEETSRREISQEVVDGMFAKELDQDEMNKQARKNHTGKERDDILARIQSRWGEEKAGELEGYRVASEEAYGIYNNAVDNLGLSPIEAFDSIPATVRDRMSQKALSAMRREASIRSQSQTVHTLFEPWQYLNDLMKTDPDAFRAVDLVEYIASISTVHLQKFADAQTDVAKLDILSKESDIFNKAALDIYGSKAKGKLRITKEQANELRDWFDAEFIAEAERLKRDLTILEKKEVGERAAIEIIFERSFLPGMEHPWSFFGSDEVVSAANAEIPGMPTEAIDEFAKRVADSKKAQGIDEPVYDRDILRLYLHFYPNDDKPTPDYSPSFFEMEESRKRQLDKESQYGG